VTLGSGPPATGVTTFAALADTVRTRGPRRPGRCLVVGIDGMSGAGKSTFADHFATALGSPCLRMDELVPGWGGLAASIDALVDNVLVPLERGEPARWRRYDWAADQLGEWVALADSATLVVEGCGVGLDAPARLLSYLIWVDTPAPERSRRLRYRGDWAEYEPFYDQWAAQEAALGDRTGTPRRADLVVDNSDRATAPPGSFAWRSGSTTDVGRIVRS
jgi:hypothetical protein